MTKKKPKDTKPGDEIAEGIRAVPRFILFVAHPNEDVVDSFGWRSAHAWADTFDELSRRVSHMDRDRLWQIVDLVQLKIVASHWDCDSELNA